VLFDLIYKESRAFDDCSSIIPTSKIHRIILLFLVHSTSVLKTLNILTFFQGIIMHKKTLFVMTGAILVAAVVTVAICNVKVASAQSANMTAGGGNMTKTMNMTAGGGNMTKTMNSTH
jgi:hypothetical protein